MSVQTHITDDADMRIIYFSGNFDEDIEIDRIAGLFTNKMTFDLKEINKITSFGVKLWIDLLKKAPANCSINFQNCSTAFIDQANMISNFIQNGKITSYMAPFICTNDHEFEILLNSEDVKFEDDEYIIPDITCKECGAKCELDDFAEDYFGFLELENE